MEIILLIALIVLNGLFAMSEIALVTARRPRLARLAEDGDGAAAVAIKLHDEPTRFLSTIQIGITSIGILNGIVGEAVLAETVDQHEGFRILPAGLRDQHISAKNRFAHDLQLPVGRQSLA